MKLTAYLSACVDEKLKPCSVFVSPSAVFSLTSRPSVSRLFVLFSHYGVVFVFALMALLGCRCSLDPSGVVWSEVSLGFFESAAEHDVCVCVCVCVWVCLCVCVIATEGKP